jgi:aminomethyltransferase
MWLNASGGIIDDVIVYRIGEEAYLIIINCANRETDVAWLTQHAQGKTVITDLSQGRSILAVQGPRAAPLLEQVLDARVTSLGRFGIVPIRTMGPEACLARTGYTGSDGFELFLSDHHATRLWDALLEEGQAHGVQPIGLGARDTLRVEAGLRLYGTDMDLTTTPLEAGLEWTVAMHKEAFIGQEALRTQQREGLRRKFVGFELTEGPVPRCGMALTVEGRTVGTVTSGAFSPLLKRPLGMGYVESALATRGTVLTLTVRTRPYAATVVKLPFWKEQARPTASWQQRLAGEVGAGRLSQPPVEQGRNTADAHPV